LTKHTLWTAFDCDEVRRFTLRVHPLEDVSEIPAAKEDLLLSIRDEEKALPPSDGTIGMDGQVRGGQITPPMALKTSRNAWAMFDGATTGMIAAAAAISASTHFLLIFMFALPDC
jgi:hypothetical protein